MNEYVKTGLFAGSAVLLTVLAAITGPRAVRVEEFKDEGELLFPSLTDPATAAELEITEFREATSAVYKFSVKKDEAGRWIIPSHDGYPADAKQRMAQVATMMIGMKKDRNVSDRKDDHAQFSVIDPFDSTTAETKGRGRRLQLKDKAGNTIADLIIGKAVEGKQGMFYVRIPEKRRVYASKFDNQVSAKFADWIETDLLKAQSFDMTALVFDNYKVDEQQGTITPGEKFAAKKDDASKWTIDGQKADEQANEEKLNELTRTLGDIKIVGVRRKPDGITAALKQATGFDRMALMQRLRDKGYYLTREGTLVSNEGDLVMKTKKGIVYTLKFGEVAPGDGDALTSGKDEAKPGEKAAEKPAAGGNHRYLMVTAEFDPSLVKPPAGVNLSDEILRKRSEARVAISDIVRAIDAFKAANGNKLPETLAKLTEKPATGEPLLKELKKDPYDQDYVYEPKGDLFVVRSRGEDKADGGADANADIRSDQFQLEDDLRRFNDEWKEHAKKLEDGKKEAEGLSKRFGAWYYVISAELFAKLKPARKDCVKAAEKPAETPAPAVPTPVPPTPVPPTPVTPTPVNPGGGEQKSGGN